MCLNETTFVDLVSGKGRALIVAAFYPFARIIGVEYSPQLTAIWRQNLQKLGVADKCEVISADAADYQFPDGTLLVFLYNPFDLQFSNE
jgi:predicted RNA methylase